MHYTRNNTYIHANHIREYQSQLRNTFSSLRTFQRSPIQTAILCEHSPLRHIHSKNLYLEKERSEKKSEHSIVSRTHQLVSSEPVK